MLRFEPFGIALALFLGACTQNPSSGGATTTGGGAGQGGGACDVTPTFTAVLQKPLSSCSGFEPPCHNAGAGDLKIDPMNAKATWKQLVGVKTFAKGAGVRVVPGDPAQSFLYRKLTDDLGPKDGEPMPKAPSLGPGGGTWTELPAAEIETVRCWIAGGAKDD